MELKVGDLVRVTGVDFDGGRFQEISLWNICSETNPSPVEEYVPPRCIFAKGEVFIYQGLIEVQEKRYDPFVDDMRPLFKQRALLFTTVDETGAVKKFCIAERSRYHDSLSCFFERLENQ